MSADYIRERVAARFAGAVLYRAYLRAELAARRGAPGMPCDLTGGVGICVYDGAELYARRMVTPLACRRGMTRACSLRHRED